MESYTVGSSDGSTIKYTRYPEREITVEYLIQGNSMPDLRSKLDHLNNILSSDEADFVFNDENSVFYTGKALPQESITKYKNAQICSP